MLVRRGGPTGSPRLMLACLACLTSCHVIRRLTLPQAHTSMPSIFKVPLPPSLYPDNRPSTIYQEELRPVAPGWPLWCPEPPLADDGEVQIGDVGFISGGKFYPIFNAIANQDGSANSNARQLLPDFAPLPASVRDDIHLIPLRSARLVSPSFKVLDQKE